MKKFWSLLLVLLLTSLSYAEITPLPDPPSRTEPSTFATKADAFLGALPAFATEANQLASDVNDAEVAAAASAAAALGYSNIALSSANFAGDWEDQAGAAAPPYAVWHVGSYWQLVNAVLDVAATEPGQTTDWRVIGDKIALSAFGGDLADAVAFAATDGAELLIDQNNSENVTIPENVILKFVPGYKLSGAVTFNSPGNVRAGSTQGIFTSTATIVFNKAGTVYLDWFSPVADCDVNAGTGTETQIQINKASGSIAVSGGVLVWTKGNYLMGPGYVYCYSNQKWLCNNSILRLGRRSTGTNFSINMIQNIGFGTSPISNFELHDIVLWGDGDENGVADNFNQCANLALYGASNCVIENVWARSHGGGNITLYGLDYGFANTLRNIKAGPGWGLNAMSVAPGKWIWENVEVVPDKYVGANPGIDIDIEDSLTSPLISPTSTHWMTNVRSRNLIFADRTTASGGTFKHGAYMDNCQIGPSYKALSFIGVNDLTTDRIQIKGLKTSDNTANGYSLWIDNVSGIQASDIETDSVYGMGFDNVVANSNFNNIKAKNQAAGSYGLFAYPSTRLEFTGNTFAACDLGDIYMGGLSNTGNLFKACTIKDLTVAQLTTTNNVFDEATKITSFTKSGTGHLSGQHIRTRRGSMVCTYDFAVNGGADGTYSLSEYLPEGATITNASYEVVSALTSSGGATVSIGVQGIDQAGIQSVLAYNNAAYGVGYHDGIPNGQAANFTTKGTAPRKISLTVAAAALTAGRIVIWVDYVWTE